MKYKDEEGNWKPLIPDTGWINIEPAAGYTSSAQVRKIGCVVYFRGYLAAGL